MPEEIEGYCIKCKAKQTMKDVRVTEAAGRRMAKGVCPVCGTKMTRFLKKG